MKPRAPGASVARFPLKNHLADCFPAVDFGQEKVTYY
jgi:hypothetical protein